MGHPTTPAVLGLDVVIATRARALVREWPKAVAGDVTAVHKARVASRRLREALPLAAAVVPERGPEHLRRDLRRITRALGRVRELDVTMIVFQAEAKTYPAAARSCASMVRALARERDAARTSMIATLARVDVSTLRERLQALAQDVAVAPRAVWGHAMESRTRGRAAALADLVAGLGPVYVPERLHAVRIAAKKLRYSLEIARDAAGLRCTHEINTLAEAQGLLGEWHDLQIVLHRMQSVLGSRRDAGARTIAALRQQCEAGCRDRHARFLASGPQIVDLCARLRTRLIGHRMLRMAAPRTARRPPAKLAAAQRG